MIKERLKQLIRKKFLWQVGYVYAGSVTNGVSLLLINIIVGRTLSTDLFGTFSLSLLVLSTVAEMSDFGLNAGLLRFAPYYLQNQQLNKLKQLVRVVWNWRLGISAVLTIGGIVFSPLIARYVFNRPEITREIMFSFLGIGGVVLVGFTSSYLQASQRFLANSIIQSLKGISRLMMVVFLYFFHVKSLYPYLVVYITIPWVLFVFSYRYLPKNFRQVKIDVVEKKNLNSQLAKFSLWLTIWSLSAILASRVDQIILSHLLGLSEVGIYAMAFQFVYVYTLLAQSISAVLMPKISGLVDKNQLIIFSKRVLKYLIPLIVIAAFIIYPSQYLIKYVFGYKYAEAIPLYVILSYGMLINFLSIPTSLIITVFNKTQLVAASSFVQLLVNIVFCFLLIPRFGVVGAAYTFVIGAAFSFLYNLVCSLYLIKTKELKVV